MLKFIIIKFSFFVIFIECLLPRKKEREIYVERNWLLMRKTVSLLTMETTTMKPILLLTKLIIIFSSTLSRIDESFQDFSLFDIFSFNYLNFLIIATAAA